MAVTCRKGNNPFGHPAECECATAVESVAVFDPFEPACADRAGNRCMECDECHEYLVSRDLDARIDQWREERWFDGA